MAATGSIGEEGNIGPYVTTKRTMLAQPYILPEIKSHIKYKLDILESYPRECHNRDVVIRARDLIAYPGTRGSDTPRARLCAILSQVWNAHVLLTSGSDQALRLIFECFSAHQGARAIIVTPTYPHALHFAQEFAHNIVQVPFGIPAQHVAQVLSREMYEPLIDALRATLSGSTRAKCECIHTSCDDVDHGGVVYLANPNLPYGYVIPWEPLRELAREWPHYIFVIDQAYIEFGADIHSNSDGRCDDPLARDCPFVGLPNMIITRTFSKFYGLADLRIGYLVTWDAHIERALRVWYNDKSVPEIVAHCAQCALCNTEERARTIAHYRTECARLRLCLRDWCGLHTPGAPIWDFSMSYGNFYLLFATDPARVCEQFEARGIQVRNKNDDIAGAIRVCVSSTRANRAVLRAIWAINSRAVLRNDPTITVACDLDGTLRDGSWQTITQGARDLLALLRERCTIVTNNSSCEAHVLLEELRMAYGTRIITPIELIAAELQQRAHTSDDSARVVYCICDVGLREYVTKLIPRAIFSVAESTSSDHPRSGCNHATRVDTILLLDGCALARAEQYHSIGSIMNARDQNVTVYIADTAHHSALAQCSCEDLRARSQHSSSSTSGAPIMMPDTGSFGSMLREMYPRAKYCHICKPYLRPIECDYYIGDGSCDRAQKIVPRNGHICARIIVSHPIDSIDSL